jgi:hypothetical protein
MEVAVEVGVIVDVGVEVTVGVFGNVGAFSLWQPWLPTQRADNIINEYGAIQSNRFIFKPPRCIETGYKPYKLHNPGRIIAPGPVGPPYSLGWNCKTVIE